MVRRMRKMKTKHLLSILLIALMLAGGEWAYSSHVIESPGDMVVIQQLGQVLVMTEDYVMVTFEVVPFRREETDKDGNGLERFDQLIAEVEVRVYGQNMYVWSGSLEELNGKSTPVAISPLLNPDTGISAVYLDIIMEVSSYPIEWKQGLWTGMIDKSWDKSNDAGEYTATIRTTVVHMP
jgi:hypothetical protein